MMGGKCSTYANAFLSAICRAFLRSLYVLENRRQSLIWTMTDRFLLVDKDIFSMR